MPVRSQRAKNITAMLTLYVVWGTTYLGIKVGLDAGLPPALFAAFRLLPAAAILFVFARLRGASLRVKPSVLRIVAIVGLFLLVGGQYGTMVAEQYVPSGLSALVVALVPLWIALVESALPDMQRPSLLGWLGLAIGFTGLAILIWPRLAGLSTGTQEMLGIGIQIVATWLWTAGSIYSKRNPVKADGFVVTAYEMLVAGATTLVIGTLLGEWGSVDLTPKAVGAIAYLTVFGSCIAFSAFVYALAHLPASKVMTYAYVNPVIAVFAGWFAGTVGLVPAEPVTASILVGMVVIVAGRRTHDRSAHASAASSPADPTPDGARRRTARRAGTERDLAPKRQIRSPRTPHNPFTSRPHHLGILSPESEYGEALGARSDRMRRGDRDDTTAYPPCGGTWHPRLAGLPDRGPSAHLRTMHPGKRISFPARTRRAGRAHARRVPPADGSDELTFTRTAILLLCEAGPCRGLVSVLGT